MAGLGIRLETDDRMIINGAAIHFLSPAQIRLVNKARFLFGRQIMRPEDASSPARRIYYALQTAYVGTPEEQMRALEEARYLISIFIRETTSESARTLLTGALQAAVTGDHYRALKYARRIIRHEDAILSSVSASLLPEEPDGEIPAPL
ncbi:flagellar biosynthesis repressor FlbT [Acetobacter sp. AN02]|uniref:flagellar biosynthesis repressor FlbT n=1 Tax=Acetobacter sp. AN02 TaxID=2894186 RepID=UPI0024342CE5|nr:flagellar biosynthesis repressor FlbT [Acetobacter sp. AN02]MDG6095302.1 flagellar biosynthesis repressor FlbT [Acetobacter sp. AN02]